MTQTKQKEPGKAVLLERAENVGRIAEEEALEANRNARFSDKVAQAIVEAEFHKLVRPKQNEGFSLDLRTYTEIIRTIARHSVSAAWVTYLYSMHDLWAAYMPPKGREEIFGHGELLADVVAPVGRAEKEGDGYRLSGGWNFCSGVLWSDWVGLGAMMELPDSKGPEYCILAVPRSEIKIIENWDTMGLRSTGSNRIETDGVYVPSHHVLPAGRVLASGIPAGGNFDENDPIYRMPFMPLFLFGFPVVALGGAERLVSIFKERTEKRVRVFKEGAKEKESSGSQRLLAEMKMQLTEMEGLIDRYIHQLESWQAEGKVVATDEEREELFALRGQVARKASDIGVRVLLTLGGNAIFKGDPVELFTRDLLAVGAHPNSLYEDAMAAYGRTIFGLSGDPVW